MACGDGSWEADPAEFGLQLPHAPPCHPGCKQEPQNGAGEASPGLRAVITAH